MRLAVVCDGSELPRHCCHAQLYSSVYSCSSAVTPPWASCKSDASFTYSVAQLAYMMSISCMSTLSVGNLYCIAVYMLHSVQVAQQAVWSSCATALPLYDSGGAAVMLVLIYSVSSAVVQQQSFTVLLICMSMLYIDTPASHRHMASNIVRCLLCTVAP
jgi:hypothetical protein